MDWTNKSASLYWILKEVDTAEGRSRHHTRPFFPTSLLWNRDSCQYVITNQNRIANTYNNFEPNSPLQNQSTMENPSTLVATSSPPASDGRQTEDANQEVTTFVASRWVRNLWTTLKGVYNTALQIGMERRSMVLAPVPENSLTNLSKMILVPIMLAVIAVMMAPLLQELSRQTFYAIFYNCKLPENRSFELKRVAVGLSLIFEHVVRKMLPVVRLRWANSNQLRRRSQLAPPIPPTVPR